MEMTRSDQEKHRKGNCSKEVIGREGLFLWTVFCFPSSSSFLSFSSLHPPPHTHTQTIKNSNSRKPWVCDTDLSIFISSQKQLLSNFGHCSWEQFKYFLSARPWCELTLVENSIAKAALKHTRSRFLSLWVLMTLCVCFIFLNILNSAFFHSLQSAHLSGEEVIKSLAQSYHINKSIHQWLLVTKIGLKVSL